MCGPSFWVHGYLKASLVQRVTPHSVGRCREATEGPDA